MKKCLGDGEAAILLDHQPKLSKSGERVEDTCWVRKNRSAIDRTDAGSKRHRPYGPPQDPGGVIEVLRLGRGDLRIREDAREVCRRLAHAIQPLEEHSLYLGEPLFHVDECFENSASGSLMLRNSEIQRCGPG